MASRATAVGPEPTPSTVPPQVQRFSIRVPKNTKKKYSVMRFNAGLKVEFKDWKQVKMERENNMKDFKGMDQEMPEFGAGSEFGRAAREEVRRKKFGIKTPKYKSEDQPWILKTNGKNGKKFRGVKEGGVGENAAYYIFSHAGDGKIEAYPLHEWYKFQIVQRYKTFSAEEAEEEFSKRDKVMNYFSLMLKKRLRNDEEEAEEADLLIGEKRKGPNKKKEKDFKISEMDEWMESDDDDDSDSDDKENREKSDDEGDAKKKKKGKDLKKKKKKNVSDDEAFEESDDGDEEGRERDYISDSSASESELELQKEIKSVAEESGLRNLLTSDDEDEKEEDKDKDKKGESDKKSDEEDKEKDNKSKEKTSKSDNSQKPNKKNQRKESSDSSSEMESGAEKNSNDGQSRKRTINTSPDITQAKKLKLENNYPSSSYVSGSSEHGITEDAVRRYLMRKPMTTTELLQKFKSKKTGLSSEKIVTIMTKILKNLNPTSQKIKGRMYFSIKAH